MRSRTAFAAAALLAATSSLHAAELRPFARLAAATVRLSDLFDGLGDAHDRVLGPAPAPGGRITVEAAQLAAIAREFGVAWRPVSTADRAVLTRPGVELPRPLILEALRAALTTAGAAGDAELQLPGPEPITIAEDAHPILSMDAMSYDTASGRFTGVLTVLSDTADPVRARLSGTAVAMTSAAVLTHRIRANDTLRPEDLATQRVPTFRLRGAPPLGLDAAIGLAARHELAVGTPVTEADLIHPALVSRGGTVRLTLTAAGIEVGAIGRALESGGLGERIRVLNPVSRAVVLAAITGTGTAHVDPGTPPVVPPPGIVTGLPTSPIDLAYAP